MNQPNDKNSEPSPATLEHEAPESVSVNRLLIAAVVVGVGLLVILLVIFTSGGGESNAETQGQSASSATVTPSDPEGETFMNREPAETEESSAKETPDSSSALGSSYRPAPGATPPPQYQAYGTPPPAGASSGPSPEEQLYQQALNSEELLVISESQGGGGQGANAQAPGAAQTAPYGPAASGQGQSLEERVQRRLQQYRQQYGQGGVAAGAMNPPPAATPPIQAPQSSPRMTQGRGQPGAPGPAPGQASAGFQERVAAQSQGNAYYQTSVTQPRSRYEVKAGSVIPAVLMTAMNSELPGSVVAQVSRDVFDSATQQHVLIPKGSKLIGSYDDQIALGQSRAMVAWSRIIFPDGRSIQLPGLDSKDLSGATGVSDEVNRHYARIFGSAIALSAIGAGFQLSQPDQGRGFGYRRTPQQVVAAELGRELSRVATEMIRQNMNIQPTIKIRKGYRFYVFLSKDLALPAPYRDTGPPIQFQRFSGSPASSSRSPVRRRVGGGRIAADSLAAPLSKQTTTAETSN